MQLNFKIIINVLFLIVSAYFISFIMFLFLPSMPYYKYPYKKVITFFDIDLTNQLILPIKKKKITKHLFNYLKEFKLQSIYFDGKTGFVIIDDHSKSVFVNLNDTYKGYKLIKINLNNVVFLRDNQKYTLYLNSKQNHSHNNKNVSRNIVHKVVYQKKLKKVQRRLINYYLHNFGVIWQNIGIIKTSQGYKITYIRPNTIFSRLGLRNGDILISINGRQLNNDADAWDIVNNLNKFDEIRVTILRNNTKKRLKYEID